MAVRSAFAAVELVGLPAAITFADTAVKSANITLLGYELSRGGMVTVKIQGDVSAVKSAVEAGTAMASKISQVVGVSVIPRPAESLSQMIYTSSTVGMEKEEKAPEVSEPMAEAEPVVEAEPEVEVEPEAEVEPEVEVEAEAEAKPEEAEAEAETAPEVEAEAESVEEAETEVKAEPEVEEEPAPVTEPEVIEVVEASVVVEEPKAKEPVVIEEPKVEEPAVKAEVKKATCNLCNDPQCTRKKGEPRTTCIHYEKR